MPAIVEVRSVPGGELGAQLVDSGRELAEELLAECEVRLATEPHPAQRPGQLAPCLDDRRDRGVVDERGGIRSDRERPREEVEDEEARAADRRQPPSPRGAVDPRQARDPREADAPPDEPRAARDRALHRSRGTLRTAADGARDEAPQHVVCGRCGAELEVILVEQPRLRLEPRVSEPDRERPARGAAVANALLVVRDVLERLGERQVARQVERRPQDRAEGRRVGDRGRPLLGRRRVGRHVAEHPLDRAARRRPTDRLEGGPEGRVVEQPAVDDPGVALERGDPGE